MAKFFTGTHYHIPGLGSLHPVPGSTRDAFAVRYRIFHINVTSVGNHSLKRLAYRLTLLFPDQWLDDFYICAAKNSDDDKYWFFTYHPTPRAIPDAGALITRSSGSVAFTQHWESDSPWSFLETDLSGGSDIVTLSTRGELEEWLASKEVPYFTIFSRCTEPSVGPLREVSDSVVNYLIHKTISLDQLMEEYGDIVEDVPFLGTLVNKRSLISRAGGLK